MPSDEELPRYDDLPLAEGGARSGWHVFGQQDQVGRVNLLTPERIRHASSLVRTGERYPLDLPLGQPDPPFFHRSAPRRTLVEPRTDWYLDDVVDNDFPQAGSQWDSLGHIGFKPDVFYNGATAEQIRRGERNTIEHWARRGIVGRGVLLDLAAVAPSGYDPSTAHAFSPQDLERARALAGIDYREGDILLLHTGFLNDHLARSPPAPTGARCEVSNGRPRVGTHRSDGEVPVGHGCGCDRRRQRDRRGFPS